MENLSPLNVKCLANMQVILESLSVSIAEIKSLVTPYYSEFQELVEKECYPLGYSIPDKGDCGTIYLGHNYNYQETYLEEIEPEIQLRYLLPFEQNKKRNPLKFEIEFGYWCDEEQNVIYFQLFEKSEKIVVITDSFAIDLTTSVPNDWETEGYDNSVYVQFTVDENLSKDKITECADVFKKYILLPFISKLKE
jgi:hypothetical protein